MTNPGFLLTETCDAVAFPGLERPIIVSGIAELLAHLRSFLPGWSAAPAPAGYAPDVCVAKEGDAFVIRSPMLDGGEKRIDKAMTAARRIANTLVNHYIAQSSELIWIHGAVVEMDGRLLAFFGRSRAGKSTVALRLIHRGHRSFGDDQVIFRVPARGPVEGVAVGIAPRARVPLPDDAAADEIRFVDDRGIAKNEREVYIRLDEEQVAPCGSSLPVAAVLFFDRQASGGISLSRVRAPLVARWVIANSSAPQIDAKTLMERAVRLAQSVPWLTLTYSANREAVDFLQARFGGSLPLAGVLR